MSQFSHILRPWKSLIDLEIPGKVVEFALTKGRTLILADT